MQGCVEDTSVCVEGEGTHKEGDTFVGVVDFLRRSLLDVGERLKTDTELVEALWLAGPAVFVCKFKTEERGGLALIFFFGPCCWC